MRKATVPTTTAVDPAAISGVTISELEAGAASGGRTNEADGLPVAEPDSVGDREGRLDSDGTAVGVGLGLIKEGSGLADEVSEGEELYEGIDDSVAVEVKEG